MHSSSPQPNAAKESSPELVDVPAAIVCVHCGDCDCSGECLQENTQSGIVHIIPWERPHASLLQRLWTTARLSTVDAEPFFAGLPDGPLAPAFRFALLAEVCALFSLVLLAAPVVCTLAPGWAKHVLTDADSRAFAARLLFGGLPLFALVLVSAHAAHGFALDVGATRQGGKRQRSRAVRFGLYACGWDLVVGPFGFVVLSVKEGIHKASAVMGMLRGLPTRSSKAFLAQHYRLGRDEQRRALRTSFWGAALVTLVSAGLFFAGLIALVLV